MVLLCVYALASLFQSGLLSFAFSLHLFQVRPFQASPLYWSGFKQHTAVCVFVCVNVTLLDNLLLLFPSNSCEKCSRWPADRSLPSTWHWRRTRNRQTWLVEMLRLAWPFVWWHQSWLWAGVHLLHMLMLGMNWKLSHWLRSKAQWAASLYAVYISKRFPRWQSDRMPFGTIYRC